MTRSTWKASERRMAAAAGRGHPRREFVLLRLDDFLTFTGGQ